MQLNQAAREIILTIVYYGPGLAGKTTNLAWLQRKAAPGTASDIESVDMHSERTLRFDMLATDLGEVQGHRVRLEFRTVPGQSYYAATRKQVLTGADGVIFVADSRREALDENIASMNEMLDNLRQLGLPDTLPIVLQYNKQDQPTAVRAQQLDPLMNVRSWPSRGTSALAGDGVADCLRDLLRLLLDALARTSLPDPGAAAQPRTWLISCHRCQAMLEVPDVRVGSIFTCGVCASTLEVVDPDRGLTREPRAAASPPPLQQRREEPSEYGLRSLPEPSADAGASALQRASRQPAAPPPAASGEFPLAGWEPVESIDESPLGRRVRVRETSGPRFCRAMILSPVLVSQPAYAAAIEPLVRMAGPIKHPHVLPLLEMRPAAGTVVLLSADMPEHEPLSVVLARRRALAPPHAMGILRQVVLALEDAARQGVVHGWVRPEVVLVNPEGQVLLDELAVPKAHRHLTRELAGSSAATEYYLAPEHLSDDAVSDLRSDMFLCGALLYRMITGEGLVTGYNAHEALHKLMASGGKPLRSVGNTVSRDLDLFYRRLTALNRNERFDTYRQLIEVLDRFGGGAKRQTLRLTQPVQSGLAQRDGPGSGGHAVLPPGRGPGHRAHDMRSPTGAIAGPARRASATGEVHRVPARKSGGGGGIVIALIAVLAVAGAAAYLLTQQKRSPPVQPPTQPVPSEPARPAAPTSATPPGRPLSPGSIGGAVEQPPTRPPAQAAQPTAQAQPAAPAQAAAEPAQAAAEPAKPAAAELDPAKRRELLTTIADLSMQERFEEAIAAAEGLPSAEDRQTQYQAIAARHEQRRQDLETRLRAVSDPLLAERLLRPALDGQWGRPGDRAWADAQLEQVRARAAAGDRAQPAAPPAAAPAQAEAPADAVAEPAADPVMPVLGALAKADAALATAAIEALPADGADGPALRRAAASLAQRAVLLDRVGRARSAKLRLTHPSTRESVDITAASAEGVEVQNPSGAVSNLTWREVGARDLGRLLDEAAAAPGATPDDHACAVTALVVGGDAVLAAVHVRRHRAALPAEVAADLDALVQIGRRAEAHLLLVRAAEAARSGNGKLLAECLGELRKTERAALPNVAAALPGLEAAAKRLAETRPAEVRLADRVAFDGPGDLAAFPDSAGTWQVTAGAAQNSEPARLARRDADRMRSVQVILTPQAKRGVVSIDFKGLKVAFDLAGGQFATQIGAAAPAAPKPCSVVERVPNTVYLAHNAETGRLAIELNSTVIADIQLPQPGAGFVLSTAGGAQVAIDEIAFARAEDPARVALRRLGWEAIGDATLDSKAGAVALNGTRETPAGITSQVPANTIGYAFEVRGQGALRIQVGGRDKDGIRFAEVPLEAQASTIQVRWGQGVFEVLGAGGAVLHSAKLAGGVSTIAFTCQGQAAIALPIRPSRQ